MFKYLEALFYFILFLLNILLQKISNIQQEKKIYSKHLHSQPQFTICANQIRSFGSLLILPRVGFYSERDWKYWEVLMEKSA